MPILFLLIISYYSERKYIRANYTLYFINYKTKVIKITTGILYSYLLILLAFIRIVF